MTAGPVAAALPVAMPTDSRMKAHLTLVGAPV
jgi:hypothetical protein